MVDDWEIISTYTLQEAIEDGTLVEVFKEDWETLTKGKPIVATATIADEVPEHELKKMWNSFVAKRTKDLAAGESPMIVVPFNGQDVWIMEDGDAVTYLYSHEY